MKGYDAYLKLKLPLCGNKWTKTIEKEREFQNFDGINRPHSQTLAMMKSGLELLLRLTKTLICSF